MQRRDLLLVVLGLASFTAFTACSSGSSDEPKESLSQAGSEGDGGGEGGVAVVDGGFTWTADNCLDGQNMDSPDVDVAHCPPVPQYPKPALVGADSVSLGAWEIGTTSNGDTYKYGGLTPADGGTGTVLAFEGGSAPVNDGNLTCWAKGYYRLRKILQDPPGEWLALRGAGFQFRFFQFQTDLRNGATGYRKISSFQNHLVKWVTVISATGDCVQPTLTKFRDYAKSELTRRGLGADGGVLDAGPPVITVVDAGSDASF